MIYKRITNVDVSEAHLLALRKEWEDTGAEFIEQEHHPQMGQATALLLVNHNEQRYDIYTLADGEVREETTDRNLFFGQSGNIVIAAPCAMTVACIHSSGKTIAFYHAETGSLLADLPPAHEYTGGYTTAAWSPDGTLFATATEVGTIIIWDSELLTQRRVYRGHYGRVNALAWSPDGRALASVSTDRSLHVWSAFSGERCFPIWYHRHVPNDVCWSPDGRFIASGWSDGTAQVWWALTGRCIQTYRGHMASIRSLAWSPDGSKLASTSDDGTVQVWKPAVGGDWWRKYCAVWARIASPMRWSSSGTCWQVSWSRGGKLLAARCISAEVGLRLWSASTFLPVGDYPDTWVQHFCWLPGGRLLVACCSKVALWHLSGLTRLYHGEETP